MRWTAYVDHLIGRGLGDSTIARYVRWVRDADEWLTDHEASLDTATATQVRDWSTDRVKFSHACRGQAAAALRHYWEMIHRPHPPTGAIVVPPAPEMVCRAVDDTQARDLVKVAFGWWPQGAAVLCGMYLALRRFEIAKMEWDRFTDDLAWYRVTGKYSKTAELPVNPTLASELAGHITNGMRWVFPGRNPARHVADATIWEWTRQVGRAAGIEDLQTHQMRHTALTVINDNLHDLRTAQTFARHTKPSTTSGYTRTTRARLREAADALDYLDADTVRVCPHCGA